MYKKIHIFSNIYLAVVTLQYSEFKPTDQLKTFLLQNVTDDIIKLLFSKFNAKKLSVIKHEAAAVILTISLLPKCSLSMSGTNSLVHPAVRGIQVKDEDIALLAFRKRLNDTIIDFYLNYIYYEMIPEEFQVRTHIFSSFFYKFLIRSFERKRAGKNCLDVQRSISKWIKNVDIFSKDFIFIPMNRRNHWYLVVICFLTQLNQNNQEITPSSSSTAIENEVSTEKNYSDDNSPNTRRKDYPYLDKGKPCMCFFDSFDKSTTVRGDKRLVAETLKEFLKMLWKTKNPTESCDWENLLCFKVVCPQQENAVDCGLYLLQYVESFFKNPIPYFGNPMPVLKYWFPKSIIIHKRAQIKKVISELREKHPLPVHSETSCSSDIVALSP